MFPVVSPTIALLLTLSAVSATPMMVRDSRVTLPIAKRINSSGGPIKLLQHDQARAAALKAPRVRTGNLEAASSTSSDSGNIAVINQAVTYVAAVGVGSPPTTYNLIVDTGSSNTWVGAGAPYHVTSTSKSTGQPVWIRYGSGCFAGLEWIDTFSLGSGLVVTNQSIGDALYSNGFTGFDGILGIGPVGLTRGTLPLEPHTEIPTITQSLLAQGSIAEDVIGVYFAPTNDKSSATGEITFGGTDSTKYIGTISYSPLTTTYPASRYVGINQTITYGDTTILSQAAGVVDTGTTLILLATSAFKSYQSVTGATKDHNTGLLKITLNQYDNLRDLVFTIGSVTLTLIPNAQIWPRALNTIIGGDTASVYLIVNDLGSTFEGGLDFINGLAFLERFYHVYDATNNRVGFASTVHTNAIIN